MKRNFESIPRARRSRRGAAMVFGLIALVVTSSIIAVLLRTASLSHRQFKREEYRAQASLLADAGIARALAKLKSQPEFTGEDWNVPGEQLSSGKSAVVHLKVVADPKTPDHRIVSAESLFPFGHPDIVKISRELSIAASH